MPGLLEPAWTGRAEHLMGGDLQDDAASELPGATARVSDRAAAEDVAEAACR
jgi:hypothetical protein